MSEGSYKLMYRMGLESKSFELSRQRVIMGRAPTCDLVIRDEKISRRHATIFREGARWWVFDMGSANGTKLNGVDVVKEALKDGDVISLGEIELRFAGSENESISHRMVLKDESRQKNVTAAINMKDFHTLLGDSSVESLSEVERPTNAWSFGLFARAAEALLGSNDLTSVLEKVMDIVFDSLPVERGIIALYDDETEAIDAVVTRASIDIGNETISIPKSIAYEAIGEQRSVIFDATSDAGFNQGESIHRMKIRSAMCSPLYNEGRVSGLIYVDTQGLTRKFTQEHLEGLSTMAVFSAVAVEKWRLHEHVESEKRIRVGLERYSSPAVVDAIVQAGGAGQMMAKECDASIIFCDLCGFTNLSEKLSPGDVAELLNTVFARLTEVIFEHDGTLDKFMGDGMMAFFGAPLPLENHRERAVRAALEMQRAVTVLNDEVALSRPIQMRVGVNSGHVVAGDIGSPSRKDYTVIGDTVNVASRLESSVSKPGQVVIGPETYAGVRGRFECVPLDPIQLKGKTELVQPYQVLRERV